METWQRILIGGGILLLGIVVYVIARISIEFDKKLTWGAGVGLLALLAVGIAVGAVGDRILEPVPVAAWLRWTFIGVAFVAGMACCIPLRRGSDISDGGRIAAYVGGLLLVGLAIRMFFGEVLRLAVSRSWAGYSSEHQHQGRRDR